MPMSSYKWIPHKKAVNPPVSQSVSMATQSVTLVKDAQNLIGVSIGGGAPYCSALYVVQVFDNSAVARDGSLSAGDEIVGVNHKSVRGLSRTELASLIHSYKQEVVISFIKLNANDTIGNSVDICIKKLKHRVVEQMSSSAADALGLSRAILVNDSMVRRLREFKELGDMYIGLVGNLRKYLKNIYDVARVSRAFGDVFAEIGVHETQTQASMIFTDFAESHRCMERYALGMLKKIKPLVNEFNIFVAKVMPDTRMTVKRYLDAKFEYLSYCLKVKEMDDEEYSYQGANENLERVETGNLEYRHMLRHRQDARGRFAKLRDDVLVKMELVDNKYVQDVVGQLRRLMSAILDYRNSCAKSLSRLNGAFPIEVDLMARVAEINVAPSLGKHVLDVISVEDNGSSNNGT